MSIFASILRSVYKLSGAKKAFALPEDALRKEIEKQNRHRGVFMPADHKAYYETIAVNGFPCLIVREHPKPSERAILYFFGGGMVIGPDKGDLPVMRKLCRETGCDVWFPFYPLCMEHCITETYAMVYECYRKMIGLYGGGNVSTCGFSSGGALALGIAAHNNAQPEPLPQPRHIVVVSPTEPAGYRNPAGKVDHVIVICRLDSLRGRSREIVEIMRPASGYLLQVCPMVAHGRMNGGIERNPFV